MQEFQKLKVGSECNAINPMSSARSKLFHHHIDENDNNELITPDDYLKRIEQKEKDHKRIEYLFISFIFRGLRIRDRA